MLLTGAPLRAADALRTGLVSRVMPDEALLDAGLALAAEMLKASPDALRISKRTFDAVLETPSWSASMELEERGQMLMIRGRRRPAQA
jgi:enoyl-CoA hydratase/carnithine racemase